MHNCFTGLQRSWVDSTGIGKAWFVALAERIQRQGLPPLGFGLLMGDDFPAMAQNQRRKLEECRIVLAQVVATRPLARSAGGR